MGSKYKRLYEEERLKVQAFLRVEHNAPRVLLLRSALEVINRHNLTDELVDIIEKSVSPPKDTSHDDQ